MDIQKVAVIGSGVMGGAIAAHIANAGVPVMLLDIVPEGAEDRNEIAKAAIERLIKTDPAPLTHKSKAKNITPGNLEDDLEKLADVDWIIEVVIEKLEIKQELYQKLDKVRKKGSIVSSNTSTLPLEDLTKGLSKSFQKDFFITHFFNPPRYMRLLEFVAGEKSSKKSEKALRQFIDIKLGKGVVDCKDTPGFIANRIGCYWLQLGLLEAMNIGISIEEADSVMGRPIGVPKTGVFALFDLIGIDLMPLIAKSLLGSLPKDDPFCVLYQEPELVTKMIEDGYTGRKGKGGFYRLNTDGGKRVKEAIDLKTGDYHTASKPKLKSVAAAKDGLRHLLTHEDIGGQYAWAVLSKLFHYTCSLIPEISDNILAVDQAMKWGYNWKYGPFELIDRLGDDEQSGPAWLAEKFKEAGMEVPAILTQAGNESFYRILDGNKEHFQTGGGYHKIAVDPEAWMLEDIKRTSSPVAKNGSAKLWDVGGGVACLEFSSKMNSIDIDTLSMVQKATDIVKDDFQAMIIGNDADNFSVGANIGLFLFMANVAAWKMAEDMLKQGQDAYMGLKYAPFPVVGAPAGMALGGGCEILLHCDRVQAHVETYMGLVEAGVGVIPGWGGCKEMLLRHIDARSKEQSMVAKLGGMFSMLKIVRAANAMPAVAGLFETISLAKYSKSAEEAKRLLFLRQEDGITMNRHRLLADAKATALELAKDYQAPEQSAVALPGKTAKVALQMAIKQFAKNGKALPHDVVVSSALATVLSGGGTDIIEDVTEQDLLDLEREAFMPLIKTTGTLDRVEHMLETGKPLRN